MRVKCVKQTIENPDIPRIYRNFEEVLDIDTMFYVFGIRVFKNITYIYIFNGNHLFEVPIEFFEVLDNKISRKWIIKVWDDGCITLWPELFYQDDFIENFSEHEKVERNLFKELRTEMENAK